MKLPRFSDTVDAPPITDESVQGRVQALVGRAIVRQLWLMFLDERGVQLPTLMPSYVPARPDPEGAESFVAFIAGVTEVTCCSAMIMVLERPGRDALTNDDREWFRLLVKGADSAGTVLRGPLLAHSRGVRWIAQEDIS